MCKIKLESVLVLTVAASLSGLLFAGCSSEGVEQVAPSTEAAAVVNPEVWPEVERPLPEDPDLEREIDELMAKMSLEQKVGQVIQAEIRHTVPEDVEALRLGSILSGGGSFPGNEKYATPEDWLALADAFWEASMAVEDGPKIPVIWGIDAVHGHNNVIGTTLFPHNIGLGAARDPNLIRRIGEVTAREVAVTGLDWTFAPTLAVVRDDRWGRTYEGYSEDPEIVRQYAGEMVRGLQGEVGGEAFLGEEKVIATAKHFLGDGGTEGGLDQGDNRASEEDLRDLHAAGYETALAAGAQTVMASFNSWHGEKLHGHGGLLTDVLKGRMGFDGFVVGDWNGHGQVEGCSNASCAAAFNAGVDMFMVPEDWKALHRNTLEQVKSGEISRERLDDAVRRILRVKKRAGLFERGKPSSRPLAGKTELLGAPEHRAVAREAVRKSLVLLKNDGGLLPLDPGQRILVAGDGADDIGKQAGGWTISWQGTGNVNSDFPGATSIWEGLRQAVEAAGGEAILSESGEWSERPDVAVVVFGEDPYAEFRGDLDSLEYQAGDKSDLALLKRFQDEGIPVVSLFLSGRPLWVNPELNASDAFVATWLPGSEGAGVADVILRAADGSVAHDFTGKLSFSWPRSVAQTVLNRGDGGDPLFAYGHGLTYADETELGELPEVVDAGTAARSTKVYYSGGPVAPWKLYAAAGGGEGVAAEGATTTSGPVSVVASDREVQEDAREVTFSGEGSGRVYLHTEKSIDLTRESNGNLALAIDVKLEAAPGGEVTLSMECGEACAGALDVTETLSALPAGEWQTVRVRLRCFEDAGADMAKIDVPFALSTEGALSLEFSRVELVSADAGDAACP